jgi:hypothetical protein
MEIQYFVLRRRGRHGLKPNEAYPVGTETTAMRYITGESVFDS